MLSIKSILAYIHQNIADERYQKLDEEHIIDEQTGVEIHLYDDWFKLTKGDEVIATMNDFTSSEQDIIWGIKQSIVDPDIAEAKRLNYHTDMANRRSKLSMLFEHPEPEESKHPIVEDNTTEYTG